jgi:hypothetical protein
MTISNNGPATSAMPSEQLSSNNQDSGSVTHSATKLHGRAFYESIGCPKFILAPMVDQSEFVRVSEVSPTMASITNIESDIGMAHVDPLLHVSH